MKHNAAYNSNWPFWLTGILQCSWLFSETESTQLYCSQAMVDVCQRYLLAEWKVKIKLPSSTTTPCSQFGILCGVLFNIHTYHLSTWVQLKGKPHCHRSPWRKQKPGVTLKQGVFFWWWLRRCVCVCVCVRMAVENLPEHKGNIHCTFCL